MTRSTTALALGRVLILTNEPFARREHVEHYARPGGVFSIIYKFGLSSQRRQRRLRLRLIMASIVWALLFVCFVSVLGWPQTNQLAAINLTSVASVAHDAPRRGLSRVSLDYLTFNF